MKTQAESLATRATKMGAKILRKPVVVAEVQEFAEDPRMKYIEIFCNIYIYITEVIDSFCGAEAEPRFNTTAVASELFDLGTLAWAAPSLCISVNRQVSYTFLFLWYLSNCL